MQKGRPILPEIHYVRRAKQSPSRYFDCVWISSLKRGIVPGALKAFTCFHIRSPYSSLQDNSKTKTAMSTTTKFGSNTEVKALILKQMTDWLTDWLNYWMNEWLVSWMNEWLVSLRSAQKSFQSQRMRAFKWIKSQFVDQITRSDLIQPVNELYFPVNRPALPSHS